MGRRHKEKGQALIVAIGILFVVTLFAAIYVGVINRIFTRTRYEESTSKAYALAQAGIEYANRMLTQSDEGADWRPGLVPPYPFNPNDPRYLLYQQYDPDFDYLKEGGPDGKGPFVRLNLGDGRVLLRVSYQFDPHDPLSTFIKIEAVGRPGDTSYLRWEDPTFDPTTDPNVVLKAYQFPPYKRSLVAYKPIYITDYALFVTNRNRREDYIRLGAPNWVLNIVGGVRTNGNLRWVGDSNPNTSDVRIALTPPLQEVEVAGLIFHQESPNEVPTEVLVNGQPVFPSDDPNFTTLGGLYRDGVFDRLDVNGLPRAITYAEPPAIDLGRYTNLARRRGGIFINNGGDIQYSHNLDMLRMDWMRRRVATSSWAGSVYTPPGVEIFLEPAPYQWVAGNPLTTCITVVRHDRAFPDGTYTKIFWNRDINGVIYAQGNVRIKGTVAPDEALTVVSGGTIYIEGFLRKGNQNSALALLATDAICVNTTQIPFGLPSLTTTAVVESDSLTGQPPFHWHLHQGEYFLLNFYSGPNTGAPPYGGMPRENIYLRIASALNSVPTLCYIDVWALDAQTGVWQYAGAFAPRAVAPSYEISTLNNLNWLVPPTLPPYIKGIWLQLNPQSLYTAWIGGIWVEPLEIELSALMYAESGPFYIIPPPGEWKLEMGTPLNWTIRIKGAIVQNWPADTYDVTEWTSKMDPGVVTIEWDPALVYNSPNPLRPNRPNLPYLPVSPSFFYEGEVPR